MAYYLVKGKPKSDLMMELYKKLKSGEYRKLKPFGNELTQSLLKARKDPQTGSALWEEEDYCSPPLAQERAAVLDWYFKELDLERVEEGDGWSRIKNYPSFWEGKPKSLKND